MQPDQPRPALSTTPPPPPQRDSPPSPPPAPTLAALPPPASAPAPPPLPAPPTPVPPPQQPAQPTLHSFIGTLDALQRAAQRQSKWPLVMILPQAKPSSAPSSAPSSLSASRPAWGPNALHRSPALLTTPDIDNNVILWRRTTGSSDAERYTAFFPTDGLPHVALLDPRSGERLCVWGNVDEANMEHNRISEQLWSSVQQSILHFLEHHSLEDGALGPLHTQDKPWAVRTRRISQSDDNLPSTSIMDDEEAAMAAAIKASLEEAAAANAVFDNDDISDMDRSDDTGSTDVSPILDDYGPSTASNEDERDHSSDVDLDLTTDSQPVLPPPSRPILIPQRRREGFPSSVESLSSSYMDRMESSLRSSANPHLVEIRRLREQQDAELARSLQEDRERERKEHVEAERKAVVKEHMLNAAARLPSEPAENSNCLTIAIRMGGGSRITRRFNRSDLLQSVADFVIASSGIITLAKAEPCLALKTAGAPLKRVSWQTRLGDLGLSNRTMFTLNEAVL